MEKRWRAEKGGLYWFVWVYDYVFINYDFDIYRISDTKRYEKGNYFRTKEEAQEVADKIEAIFNKQNKR